jgi:hypothetical protein
MHVRRVLIAALQIGLVLAARVALSQDAPVDVAPVPEAAVPPAPVDWRGPGGGLLIIPVVLWWLPILAWIKTVDWISRDATKRAISPAFWSSVCGLPLPVAAIFAWWVPWPAVGIVLMVLAWLVPVGFYAVHRNTKVAKSETILTLGHGRRIFAAIMAQFGVDIGEPLDEGDILPKVSLVATGGKDTEENEARLKAASELPGFEDARQVLLGAVVARATTVVIDIGTDTTVRHEVDGVWGKPRVRQPPRSRKHLESFVEVQPSSRAAGDAIAAVLEVLSGIEPKAASGAGPFVLAVDGKPRNARLTVRRSPTAAQLTITIEAPSVTYKRLADLGMDDAVASRLGELVAAERGIILLSSPAGSGLTTTFDLFVESADRLLRDFVSIEDAASPPREIQNVKPFRFDARTGVTPMDALAEALREYPKVIVTRDVRDKEFVSELVRLAGDGHLVIMSLRAADATEAIARVMACGVSPRAMASTLLGSLSQRLVRRLCPKCREDMPTPAPLLAKLKKTIEELPKIRKASQVGCRLCYGSGYLGRAGAFELASGVTVRKAIATGSNPDDVRKAATSGGMRPFKVAFIDLVVSGASSLEEVQRALTAKSGHTPPPPAAAGSKPGGARPASAAHKGPPPPPSGATPKQKKSP